MDFCPNCDNLFGYNDDIEKRIVQLYCSTCDIYKKLENHCISTKTFKYPNEISINYDEALYDKCLPVRSNKKCDKCDNNILACIRNEDLSITYVCKNEKCKNIMKHTFIED